jgi:hypothetical protein
MAKSKRLPPVHPGEVPEETGRSSRIGRSESRRSVGLGTTFSLLSTPIAVRLVISSPRGWLIGKSVDYGNHSPNSGKYLPNETAHPSRQN